jgi:hypothetical protein
VPSLPIRQVTQRPCQAFSLELKSINQILLKTKVTGQQLANETSEKRILIVQ